MGRMILGYQKTLAKSKLGIVLMLVGIVLIGLPTGFGPISVARPDPITIFGPKLVNFSLGQWLFSIVGLGMAAAGFHISDFR